MDSLMASSGPKEGSTSPSATPLEKEPGGESTGMTQGQTPGIQHPSKGGTTNNYSSVDISTVQNAMLRGTKNQLNKAK